MDKFLIHVIDEISCHKKNDKTYQIIPMGSDELGNPVFISHNDAIYLVEGDSFIDAIESISNTIQVKNADESDISLSDAIKQSFSKKENKKEEKDSLSTIDMDDEEEYMEEVVDEDEDEVNDEEDVLESYNSYNRSINTLSHMISSVCQINREENGEKWVEFHKITFYAMEESKIMTIDNK